MKILLRSLFSALLIVSLATQTARMAGKPPRNELASLSNGLAKLGGNTQPTDTERGLTATFAPCPDPILATTIGFDGANQAMRDQTIASPTARRYAYLGAVGTSLSAAEISARWVAASVLTALGLRQTPVPISVVLVQLPDSCPELAAKDWSLLSPLY